MPKKNFVVQKNLLDMEYQQLLVLFSIVAVGLATFLISLLFSSLGGAHKLTFGMMGFIVGITVLFIIWDNLDSIKEKVSGL